MLYLHVEQEGNLFKVILSSSKVGISQGLNLGAFKDPIAANAKLYQAANLLRQGGAEVQAFGA